MARSAEFRAWYKTTDSGTSLCEEYQELTLFLGYSPVSLMQESHIFKWADKKFGRQPITKFSGFVGDTKADITTYM